MADQDGKLSIEELKTAYIKMLEEITAKTLKDYKTELRMINYLIENFCEQDKDPEVVKEFEENYKNAIGYYLYNILND